MMNMKAFFVLYAYVIVVALSLSWLFATVIKLINGV